MRRLIRFPDGSSRWTFIFDPVLQDRIISFYEWLGHS